MYEAAVYTARPSSPDYAYYRQLRGRLEAHIALITVIGMTPATGGEVDDLLEPVWSWPERTMLTNRSAKGCPAAEPLPPSDRGTTVR